MTPIHLFVWSYWKIACSVADDQRELCSQDRKLVHFQQVGSISSVNVPDKPDFIHFSFLCFPLLVAVEARLHRHRLWSRPSCRCRRFPPPGAASCWCRCFPPTSRFPAGWPSTAVAQGLQKERVSLSYESSPNLALHHGNDHPSTFVLARNSFSSL